MKKSFLRTLILTITFMIFINNCTFISAEPITQQQKVKVGWFTFDGVQFEDTNSIKRGYCYDYYQEIAKYANLTYEYVPGTWQECLDRLKTGEIDILSFVKYTDERNEYMDFSTTQIGQNYTVLSTLSENTDIISDDFSTFNGKIIGAIRGAEQISDLHKLMQENNFSCSIVEYDELEDVVNALNGGDIDMILHHSMRIFGDNERVVHQFAPSRIYIAVKKGDYELLSKIDKALEALKIYDPYLSNRLDVSYFSSNSEKNTILTREEREFLDKLGTVTVLMPPTKGFLANIKDGQCQGIYYDIMNEISERLGIECEYYAAGSFSQMPDIVANNNFSVLCGFFYDYSWADTKNVYITSPFMTLQYYKIQNSDTLNKKKSELKIAATKNVKFNTDYIYKNYSQNNVTFYDTDEECLKAVQKGEQDIAFCDSYTTEYYMQDYHYNKLSATLVSYKHDVCFATSENDGIIFSTILSKAIANIGNDLINEIIFNNITDIYEGNTFERLIYTNPVECIIAACIFILIIIFVLSLVYMYRVNLHKNIALQEASNAKTSFLSNMSHEIRTPLNGINGMLSILKQRPELENDTYINNALISVKHLSALINDILDMSKIESETFSLKRELLSSKTFQKQIHAIIKPLADEKHITFTSSMGDIKYKYIYTDPERLRQVIINLLSNAVKYTPEKGAVYYDISTEEISNHILRITFKIADTGIGMSEEFLKKAFEPFEQEERSRTNKGTGLGLAITKKLIEAMDGTINIDSEVGRGTTVTVTITAEATNTADMAENDKKLHEAIKNFETLDLSNRRVLIVEDNEINIEIAQIQLSSLGLMVELAHDGEEAVEKFRSSEENYYDIIFMDIMMPKKSGLEATTEIRAMDRPDAKEIPIVAMTANAFVEDVHKSLESGMNYHLSKPFEVSQMKEILARVFLDY